ncbi:hypothetical protein DPMN_101902 [Dreissena polymorpha]|uniref:Uncharacterized protein n=1 Tax=Dreissena polymorpha TaxID=45954 RepID=A0A9D4R8Q0_DREPO|nr:hypothetical protein DPMN_101902 [Dreissena polymorpha]
MAFTMLAAWLPVRIFCSSSQIRSPEIPAHRDSMVNEIPAHMDSMVNDVCTQGQYGK